MTFWLFDPKSILNFDVEEDGSFLNLLTVLTLIFGFYLYKRYPKSDIYAKITAFLMSSFVLLGLLTTKPLEKAVEPSKDLRNILI